MGNSAAAEIGETSGEVATLGIVAFCLIFLAGCSSNIVYPISTGSHAPTDPANKDKKYRFVVWSNHPPIANAISSLLQRGGHIVVERARIMEIFNEQKMRLTNSADDDGNVLRVGRLLGADRVVFAEATVKPESYSTAYAGSYGGRFDASANSGTLYNLSVSVRAVSVETGEVRWQGSAYYPSPVNSLEQGLMLLASAAVGRAWCRFEDGDRWTEQDGCKKKD